MKKDILLEAEGFQTLFEISEERDNFLKTQITLTFLTDSNRGNIQTLDNFIERKDLLRLAEYYEKHIFTLRTDCNYESDTFLTQEIAFETKAFCGEIRDNIDGEFSIM